MKIQHLGSYAALICALTIQHGRTADQAVISEDLSTEALESLVHGGGHGGDHGGGHGGGHGGDHGGGHGGGHGGDHGGGERRHHEPIIIHRGDHNWYHWDHPYFERPFYDFVWERLNSITCVAETADGEEFEVTEDGYRGHEYRYRLDEIEDSALDRCYAETNGDSSCSLLECRPHY